MNKIVIALAAAGIVTSAHAEYANSGGDAVGYGVSTCAEYLRDVRKDAHEQINYFNWAQGYITGYNAMIEGAGKQPKDLSAWYIRNELSFIDNDCREHRDQPYSYAASHLYQALPYIQSTDGPPPPQPHYPGEQSY